MRKRFGWTAVLMALVFLVSACGGSQPAAKSDSQAGKSQAPAPAAQGGAAAAKPASGEPVKLGAVLTLSGPAAGVGVTVQRGLELAQAKINAAGGINGRPIELVIKDDQGDPAKAAAAATQVIEKDQVLAIIGGAITVTTVAMAPVAKQYKKVLFSPTFSGDNLAPPATDNRMVFRVGLPDRYTIKVLSAYAAKKYSKIGILGDTGPAGQSMTAIATKELQALNKAPVGKEAFNMGATDLTPQLMKLKDAGAEAIIVQAVPGDTGAVARGLKQLGYKAQILGHLGFADPAFRKMAGKESEGAFAIDSYDPDNPLAKEFVAAYEAKYGKDPFYIGGALQAYDTLFILSQALTKAGLKPEALPEAIEGITGFKGASGGKDSTINFSKEMHDGNGLSGVVLQKVENGVMTKVQVGVGQ